MEHYRLTIAREPLDYSFPHNLESSRYITPSFHEQILPLKIFAEPGREPVTTAWKARMLTARPNCLNGREGQLQI